MGKNQIDTLIPNLSFSHNLCFKYIYVLKALQWYKEIFNPMNFDFLNTFLKIWDSMGIPTRKVGIHLEVCGFIPSHS
jgi:hypothetical protein